MQLPNWGTYTPHSYVDYSVDGISITPATTIFSFPKSFLRLDHLQVWRKPAGSNTAWAQLSASAFTASGTTGSGTITLNGLAPARATGDFIRILRTTPDTAAGRLVDFVAGPLDPAALDESALQTLYIAQELRDEGVLKITREYAGEDYFDAQGRRIRNIAAPINPDDAVRFADLAGIALATGDLPSVTPAMAGSFLLVDSSGVWSIQSPAVAAIAIGIVAGGPAFRAIGVADATSVPDRAAADTRYAQQSENLADLDDVGAARAALGLGTAAVLDVGTGANQVVQLGATARYPNADGRDIDLSAHALVSASGKVGCVYASNLGTYGTSITGAAYASIANAGSEASQYNSDNDVVRDVGNKRWALAASSTFWVTVRIQITNENANRAAFAFKIRRDVTGVPTDVYVSPTTNIAGKSGATYFGHAYMEKTVMIATGGSAESIDVQAALIAPDTTGDARIINGEVIILKVN